MFPRLRIGYKKIREVTRLFIFLSLGLYLFGLYGYEMHRTSHAEVHTKEVEKDPCHRSLYHQDKQAGCAHNSHYSKSDDCSLCDFIVSSRVIALPNLSFETEFVSDPGNTALAREVYQTDRSGLSSRAPPAI